MGMGSTCETAPHAGQPRGSHHGSPTSTSQRPPPPTHPTAPLHHCTTTTAAPASQLAHLVAKPHEVNDEQHRDVLDDVEGTAGKALAPRRRPLRLGPAQHPGQAAHACEEGWEEGWEGEEVGLTRTSQPDGAPQPTRPPRLP